MKLELLNKEYNYVVGVSGGCDSMYLLDNLYNNGYKIYVVHINYNYREDSYEDYQLVKDYCHNKSIPFFYKECHEDHSGNFQDYARKIRYNFYKEIYNQYSCQGVILGHHFDDCIENIYMQLSHHNTYYYLGIREINTVYDMTIIRPMLNLSKDYIRQYCHTHHIPYRDDYTNFETDFERDYIRNKVLNTYSEKDKNDLYNKALLHNKRIDQLLKEIQPYYTEYNNKGSISYQSIKEEYLNLFLYLILKDKIEPRLISSSLIEEIRKQLASHKPNIEMNLPVNYLFIKEYDNIYIISKYSDTEYSYIFNSYTDFNCNYFHLSQYGHINEGIELSEDDYPIMIRNFKNGDSIKTVYGTKKVSRLFIDNKIPLKLRKIWPILLNNKGEIILIPHLAKNIDYLSTNCNLFVIK